MLSYAWVWTLCNMYIFLSMNVVISIMVSWLRCLAEHFDSGVFGADGMSRASSSAETVFCDVKQRLHS